MTTTDPGADKAVQALPELPEIVKRADHHYRGEGLADAVRDYAIKVQAAEREYAKPALDWLPKSTATIDALSDEVAQLRAALTHRQQGVVGQAEWLPIETAPKDGSYVLVFDPDTEEPQRWVASWCEFEGDPDGGSWLTADLAATLTGATLWQPLAPHPSAAPPAQPQSEALAMDLLRTEFKRECDDTDLILRMLGLEPENCRTDGGSLKTTWILEALKARDRLIRRAALAAQPPERAAQQEAQEGVATVSECEACFTPDVCQLRGTCDHYSAAKLRVASPPLAVEPMQALTEERIKHLWDKACRTVTVQGGGNDVLVFADYLTRELRGIGKQG